MARSDDDHEVGYGKPPRQHQFKKGVSGNPRGRPKRPVTIELKRSFNGFHDAFLKEMERHVPLREGGVAIELPTFEAVLRSISLAAIKGNTRAQKILIEQAKLSHQEKLNEMTECILIVDRYKAEWEPRFRQARERGLPQPTQLPHPDHVNFSSQTGLIEVTGPVDKAAKALWEELKQTLRLLEKTLSEVRATAAEAPRSKVKRQMVQALEAGMNRWERQVPPGWNWREEIGDFEPKP